MLCAGLASCEMKEEILGDKGFSGDSGYLNMGVVVDEAINAISTKADGDEEIAVGEMPADGFIVELVGPDDYTKEFTYKSDMEPVELPVGDFTVYAHTDGSLDDTTAPFYGKRDNFTIKKDAETKVGIQCEMMNTMFQLKYDPGFISMYRKWEITVTAGKHSKPYLFEKKDLNDTPQNPDPIYWYLGDEEVKNFIVEVQAWTQDGNIPVTATQSFSKEDQAAYTGGEAVNITMMPGSPDVSTEGTASIDINVTLFSPYEDINESIEIDGTPTEEPEEPVGPDEEEPINPDEPGGDAITISDNGTGYLTNGVTVTGTNYPKDVAVVMDVPKGIKNVFVLADSDNKEFKGAMGLMADGALISGEGLDLTSDAAKDLSELFALPISENGEKLTKYTFSMNSDLFDLLGNFGGEHSFTLRVIDQEGNEKSATLSITVNSSAS